MSVLLDVRFDSGRLGEVLKRLAKKFEDPTPILRAIGVGMRENVHTRFEEEKDPSGQPWKPLHPEYAATKRGPGILRENGIRGGLMGSITFKAGRHSVEIGSNRIYARIHQLGGTIVPKRGNALVFTMGGNTIMARSVTIPARPYLGINQDDEEVILDIIEDALDRLDMAA